MDVYKGVKITSKNLRINTANKSQISSFNILKSDVFFTPSSETRNDLGFAKTALETIEQGVFSYHLIRYRQKNKTFYESFIDYIVRTSRYRIIFYKEAVGAQRYVLSIKTFNNTVIPKPTIQEQERIVFLLNIIDSLITLHQRELKNLKNFKKSLFQKMIVGKNLTILSTTLTKMTNVWEQERFNLLFRFVCKKGFKNLPILAATKENGMQKRQDINFNVQFNLDNIIKYKLVEPGQFVIHLSSYDSGLAHSAILGVTSPAYSVVDFINKENNDDKFWTFILKSKSFIDKLSSISYGLRVGKSINLNELNNIQLKSTNLIEQNKISKLFSLLNSLIALHQRELKILKIFKKSLFVKMIVGKNLTILSVALTKMTNVWEQERLGNLYQFGKSGGTPLSSNKEFYNGHIPFLSITDISNSDTYIYKTEKNITLKGLKNSSAWIVPKDSISLAMYASIGKVAILKNNVSTSQAIFNMVFSDELNLRDFIFYALKRMELLKLWNSLSSSGTQSNLTSEIIKNYKITLTKNFSERHKINKLFNKIYSLITLHQRGQFRRENEKKIRNFVL
ncbi:restriction endonuclease subunit S [Mycoplasmopsis cynos]|uniref:Type I restriction modification DNA specificity domain n=1 Tax=Mycoplasmopsis cynos TaxID=171284 RepID=A0A449AIU6_9BACT|nr:restriction endonuclease subunit S [Mycoplasmopsis cynos]VEU64935.1 Type I restriction modification DNA specificity domain [Mycoplasmopsis cynos]